MATRRSKFSVHLGQLIHLICIVREFPFFFFSSSSFFVLFHSFISIGIFIIIITVMNIIVIIFVF